MSQSTISRFVFFKLNSCLPLCLRGDKKANHPPLCTAATCLMPPGGKEQQAMNIIQRAIILLCVVIVAASAIAQTAATADLRGTVQDPNGAVIQSATISVRDDARNFERSTQSN